MSDIPTVGFNVVYKYKYKEVPDSLGGYKLIRYVEKHIEPSIINNDKLPVVVIPKHIS